MTPICIKTSEIVETEDYRGKDSIKTTRCYIFPCLLDSKGRTTGVQVVTHTYKNTCNNNSVIVVDWGVTEQRDGKGYRDSAKGGRAYRSGIAIADEADAQIKLAIRAYESRIEKMNPMTLSKM